MQRVRLIVAAKKIPNEEINIHLKQKPEWFLSKINPFGLVPVIEHEGHLIRESAIAFGMFPFIVLCAFILLCYRWPPCYYDYSYCTLYF